MYLASINSYCKEDDTDQKIELFARFVGLYPERLSYSVFENYVTMIKASGLPVHVFFATQLKTSFIDYSKVRGIYKEMFADSPDETHRTMYSQLKGCVRKSCSNPYIANHIELEEYEVFKDFLEMTLRSKFKSTGQLLKDFLVEVGLASESLDDSDEDVLSDFGGSKYVTKQQFANFLLRNMDLTDYSRG